MQRKSEPAKERARRQDRARPRRRVKQPEPTLRFASLNAAGERDPARIFRDISEIPELAKADVLFLQEAEYSILGVPESLKSVAKRLGMHYAYAAERWNSDGTAMAMAILSPHRLGDDQTTSLERIDRFVLQRDRIALAATVHTPYCAVRVVNVHMDTRINSADRRRQLDSALCLLAGFPGPQVIAGDFNTADVRWYKHLFPVPYRERQTEAVKVSLQALGFQTPFDGKRSTIKPWGFQLDWIFIRGLRNGASKTLDVPFTDHRAVTLECRIPSPNFGQMRP